MALRSLLRVVIPTLMIGMSGLIGASGATAEAADQCQTPVIDGAHVLGSDIGKVRNAASVLQSKGADVRVRTVSNGLTADQYEQQLLQQCSDWASGEDGFKSSLVLYLVTLNPNSLLFDYGYQFNSVFQDGGDYSQSDVQSVMYDRAHAGNIADGVVSGINLTGEGIDNNGVLPHNGSDSEGLPQGSSSPAGNGSAVKVTLIIVGALVLLALLAAAGWWLLRRKQDHDVRMKMRQRALSARDATTALTNKIGDEQSAEAAVRKAKVKQYSVAGPDVMNTLNVQLRAVSDNYTDAVNGMASAAAAGEDADNPKLTAGEYEELALRYEQTLEQAEAASAANDQIDSICAEAKTNLDNAGTKLTEASNRQEDLQAQADSLKAEDVKIDSIQGLLDVSGASIDAAKQWQSNLQVLQMLVNLDAQQTEAEEAITLLTKQRADLTTGLPALDNRVSSMTAEVEPAAQCFARVSSAYAESSWESVRGNGTEAMNRIQQAKEAHTRATEAATMENQQWDKAVSEMQEGNNLLDEAESLLRSIMSLETNLAEAKQDAPHEIEAAAADIEKARQYLQQWDADINDDLENDLARAEKLLEQARAEFNTEMPDYPAVVQQALAANQAADTIFAEASDEHEQAVRLRQQASTMLTQATAAVSKAEEYIEDHSSDVEDAATDQLNLAKESLRDAERASDPAKVLKKATEAKKSADWAYSKASSDFQDAESRRAAARRRAQQRASSSSTVIVGGWGSPSHHSSGSINIGGGHHSGGGISFGGGGGGHHHGGGIGF